MSDLARATACLLVLILLGGCGGPAVDPARAPADVDGLVTLLVANELDAVAFDAGSLLLKRQWLQVPVFVEDGGASLQAVFPHTGRRGAVDPDAVARWNSTRRFGRAYLDDDGRPVLASDLLLGEDVGPDAVVVWCGLVLDMAEVFAVEVWPVPAPLQDPPNE